MSERVEHAYTVGSLFAGIGGFDLGFERAGFRILWQCESDEFCRAVLRHHWPDVPCYSDVRTLAGGLADASREGSGVARESHARRKREPGRDAAPRGGRELANAADVRRERAATRRRETGARPEHPSRIDVLVGGFPCQDVSDAGKRVGLDGDRSGLWYEFDRVIGELRPRIVVIENVRGLIVRGIDAVLGCLAARGYDAEWAIVRASDVDAPHRRERIFIIAYRRLADTERHTGRDEQQRHERRAPGDGQEPRAAGPGRLADASERGLREPHGARDADGSRAGARLADSRHDQSQEPTRDDGLDGERAAQRGRAVVAAGPRASGGTVGGDHSAGTREPRRAPAENAIDLADADGDGRGGFRGEARRGAHEPELRPHVDGSGARLADAADDGRERGGPPHDDDGDHALGNDAHRRDARGVGLGAGVELDDAAESRSQGDLSEGREGGIHGRAPRSTRWPSRPGEPQHEWEPPRVVSSSRAQSRLGRDVDGVPDRMDGRPRAKRRQRLGALGNAIVPQVAELVAYRVIEILHWQEQQP